MKSASGVTPPFKRSATPDSYERTCYLAYLIITAPPRHVAITIKIITLNSNDIISTPLNASTTHNSGTSTAISRAHRTVYFIWRGVRTGNDMLIHVVG